MRRKLVAALMAACMLTGIGSATMKQATAAEESSSSETVLDKSTLGNPILGFDGNGETTYGGDPSVLVDGDTVYVYVGHDTSSGNNYVMPDYLCYSTTDMVDWKYEGKIMDIADVGWAGKDTAWASQVMKHNGKYYLYYCSTNNQDNNIQSIGVAVADSPTGPFKDKGSALVKGSLTTSPTNVTSWNDIDPTAWIETDEQGKEHIYLAWGNTNCYLCELNDDMVSVKDQNGDGKITMTDDIMQQTIKGMTGTFTEAPYLYRRQDENGKYYGQYYLFYAMNWREEMAYATTDDLMDGQWTYGGRLMEPSASANTNHPAVFDFNGKTYFIYHNGALAWGSGYRRSVCVEEFTINDDGTIDPIQETSTGISGTSCQILDYADAPIAHKNFNNTLDDNDYPITADVSLNAEALKNDATWEIVPGKADKTKDSYVSIESYNKPGLYLKAEESGAVVLTQDYKKSDKNGVTEDAKSMTFRTREGLDGYGVSFESVQYPGNYLVSDNGSLKLSVNPDSTKSTFTISSPQDITTIKAQKTTRTYLVGDKFNANDIRVFATYEDGTSKQVTNFTTDADKMDMTKAGKKTLTVSYTEKGLTKTAAITITVEAKPVVEQNTTKPETPKQKVPKKNAVYTVGSLKYKVTKSAASGGTVAVTASTKKNPTSVKIADTVKLNGYTFKVTSIEKKAFYNKKTLKTVTIGKNVKSIGKNAFKNINKKAVFKVTSSRYNAVKKLLTSTTGFEKKTMKLKKIS